MNSPDQQLGVLFADIVDSTKLAFNDSGKYHDHIRPSFYQRLQFLIKEHGGDLMHEAGDGVMITFESANEAIEFGIKLQEWASNQSFKLRIGIHFTTEKLHRTSLAALMGYTPTSEALNIKQCFKNGHTSIALAARILKSAIPGQLLISENAYNKWTNEDDVEVEEWKNRIFKGFPNPLSVYEVLSGNPSLGEPGMAFFPEWYRGEENRFFERPEITTEVTCHLLSKTMDGARFRAVTIHGDGGFGKTRLAFRIASCLAGEFDDGIKMVRFGGVDLTDGEKSRSTEVKFDFFIQELYRVLTDCDVPEDAITEQLLEAINEKWKASELLLVVDNYESIFMGSKEVGNQILYVDQVLANLLNLSNCGRILITSRQKHGSWSHGVEVKNMKPNVAWAFFSTRCRMDFDSLSTSQQEAVKSICERCCYIPLYMELISMWSNSFELQELASGLGKFECPLGESRGDSIQEKSRHDARRNSFGYSLNLLEQKLNGDLGTRCFQALGWVDDPIPIGFIAFLLDQNELEVAYAVGELRNFHLVRTEDRHGVIMNYLHAMAQQEAREMSASNERVFDLIEREAFYCVKKTHGFFLESTISTQLQKLYSKDETRTGNVIMNLRLWLSKSAISRSLIVSMARDTCDGNINYVAGELEFREGSHESSGVFFEQAHNFYRNKNFQVGQANALARLGDLDFREGSNASARDYYREALNLYKANYSYEGAQLGEANTFRRLGDLAIGEGEIISAKVHFSEALKLYEVTKSQIGKANVALRLGDLAMTEGEIFLAKDHFSEALKLYEVTKSKIGKAHVALRFGDLKFDMGKNEVAFEFYSQALALYEVTKNQSGKADVFLRRGDLAFMEGYFLLAKDFYSVALKIYEDTKNPKGKAKVALRLGDLAFTEGYYSLAKDFYSESLAFYEKVINLSAKADVFARQGDLAFAEGYHLVAKEYYSDALKLYGGAKIQNDKAKNLLRIIGFLENNDYLNTFFRLNDYFTESLSVFKMILLSKRNPNLCGFRSGLDLDKY